MEESVENPKTKAERAIDPKKPFPYRFPSDSESQQSKWRRAYEAWWKGKFQAHIPEEWLGKPPERATSAPRIITYADPNELTNMEAEAILTESNHMYGLFLLRQREVSSEQLALFFAHPELSSRHIFDMVKSHEANDMAESIEDPREKLLGNISRWQEKHGMTNEEIENARSKARKIISERVDFNKKPSRAK